MDLCKLRKYVRVALIGMLSLMLAFSGMSPQALAEAVEEVTTSNVVEEVSSEPTSQTVGATQNDDTNNGNVQVDSEDSAAPTQAPVSAVPATEEPQRWTIQLMANGGTLPKGTAEEAASIASVEDEDPVTIPNVYEREGYEFVGWSTLADPAAWHKTRKEALAADPDAPEPKDKPLFVPAETSLYNLSYAYVTLEDGTVRQVSDVTATQGSDEEGREVQTCDLRGRIRDGKLSLYAQWKKLPDEAEKPAGDPIPAEEPASQPATQPSQDSDASADPEPHAPVTQPATQPEATTSEAGQPEAKPTQPTAPTDRDTEDAGTDSTLEQTESAQPVASPPTGAAALLADPQVVLDSGAGDPQATAALDEAQHNLRIRSLLANPQQVTATPSMGMLSLGIGIQSASNVTDARPKDYPDGLDGSYINDFSLCWNTSDTPGTNDGDLANLTLEPKDDVPLNMQARLQFTVSGEKNYPAGTIQFTIPAQVIQDRNGELIGSMTIGVPEEPDTTQSFAYRLVTPTDGTAPYYVITNTRILDSATTGVIQFSIRSITPHVIKSGQKSPKLQAEMTLTTSRGNQMVVGTDSLTATINTEEEISSAYKNGGKVMDVSSPLVPDEIRGALENLSDATTVNDYVLVRWNSYSNVRGNQSFDFSMNDALDPDDAVVQGGQTVSNSGAVVLGATGSASASPAMSYQKTVLDDSYLESGESRYENVWTAYPKSTFEDDKDYTLTNHVTWTVTPLDGGEATSKSAVANITYHNPKPISFTATPGHYTIEKETLEPHRYSSSTNTSLTDLHGIGTGTNSVAPKDATINFTVTAYGEIMEQTAVEGTDITTVTDYNDGRLHQRYVTMEAADDAVYLNGNYMSELRPSDYYISRVQLHDPYVYTYGHEDGDETKEWGYYRNATAAPLPTVELWGLSEAAGGTATTWTKLATMSYGDANARTVTVLNNATHEGNSPYIDLPKSLSITRVKVVSAAKDYDALRLQYNPSITLKCDDSSRAKQLVDQLFETSDSPRATLRNDVTLAAYHGNAVQSIAGHEPDVDLTHAQLTEAETAKVFAIPASSQSVDYARTHQMDQARYGKDMWHYSSLAYMRGAVPRIGVTSKKTLEYDQEKDLNAGAMRATLHYTATVHEQSNILTREAYDQYVADGAIAAEKSGTWYDLLPPGVTPDLSSIYLRDEDSVTDAYIVENYENTGRTLLVVKASLVPQPTYNDIVQNAVGGKGYWAQGYYDEPRLSFDAVYSYADFLAKEITAEEEIDELVNVIAFQSKNEELGNQEGMMGEYDDATGGATDPKEYRNKETAVAVEPAPDVQNMAEVMSNLDSATTTKKPTFVYARAENRISVDRSSVSSITKQVASDAEGVYRTGTDDTDAGNNWANHTNQVNVYEGHGYTYRIEVARGNGQTSGIVLYDALENYKLNEANSDYKIREQSWNGTFAGVDVSQLKAKGVAPVVYYSTTVEEFDNRGAAGNNTNVGTDDDSSRYPVEDDNVINTLDKTPSAWVRADQYSGSLGAVKAVAIDCSKSSDGTDFVLPQGESIVAYIRMRAPVEVANDASSKLFKTVNPQGSEDDPNNNSHAFNNVYISSTVSGDSQTNTKTEFYHPDYVKVGILPYKITVNKVWDDANNQDGKRPNAVSVQLLANGATAMREDGTEVSKIKLGSAYAGETGYSADGWSYTIEDIPYVDASNNPIRYTLREDPIRETLDDQTVVNLYAPSYLRTDDAHLQITNRRVPETVDLVVNKTWNDDSNAHGARPSTIRLRLYADGKYLDTKTVREGADGNWSYTFTDLPAYQEGEQGKRVSYKVEEERDSSLQNYATDYEASNAGSGSSVAEDGSILGSVNITNTYSNTGLLGISKTVENVKSAAGRDADFSFKVELFGTEKDAQQNPLPLGDTYSYYVLDAEGQRIAGSGGSLRTGGTVTIKGGQRAIVEGLPIGSTYKVSELATSGFYQSASANTTGTITAGVAPSHAADARFTNTYSSSGSFQLKATKRLQGQKLGLYAFRFQAYRVFNAGTEDEYEQIERSVSNSAGGDVDAGGVSTGDVTFARFNVTDKDLGPDGTLELLYRIREVNAGRAGYTYADNVEQVRVRLVDQGDGTILATQTPQKVESGTSHIKPLGDDTTITTETFYSKGDATFTNSYNASGTLELTAWKALKGGTLEADKFTFLLTPLTAGAPVASTMTATNDANGVVNFPVVPLTGVNGGKSYIYKVSEESGGVTGVNYSDEVYYYRVDVADDGAGTLTATTTVVKPKENNNVTGNPDDYVSSDVQPIITNTLEPGSLAITKSLAQGSAYHDEKFEFQVVLKGNDITADSSFSYKVGESEPVSDPNAVAAEGSYTMTVTLAKDQTATITGIPAGTSYQVFENALAGWRLEEQSNAAGTIASQSTAAAVFTNTYDAATATARLYATKTLDGASAVAGAFSFSLTGQGNAPMPADATGGTKTVSNGEGGLVDFGNITYTAAGTYTYVITEDAGSDNTINYDATEWTATVTVVNNGTEESPALVATVRYAEGTGDPSGIPPTFQNTHKPGELTVTKHGVNVTPANKDAEFGFTVQLQNSGQAVDNVSYYITNDDDTPLTTQSVGPEAQNGANPLSVLGRIASGARDALVSFFTPRVAYAAGTESDTFGTIVNGVGSCTWEWDEGTSTITVRATTPGTVGEWRDADFTDSSYTPPWGTKHHDAMKHFVVERGSDGSATIKVCGDSRLSYMFSGQTSIETADLRGFDMSTYKEAAGTSFGYVFSGCTSLITAYLPEFSGDPVTINKIFLGCVALTEVSIPRLRLRHSSFGDEAMIRAFEGCASLTTIDLSEIEAAVSGVDLDYMFNGCTSLTEVNLGIQNAQNITSAIYTFVNCSSLAKVDMSALKDATNLTDMRHMFEGCVNLKALDFSTFNGTAVGMIGMMLKECRNLESLDLSGLSTTTSTTASNLFAGSSFNDCRGGTEKLAKIVLGDGWKKAITNAYLPPVPNNETYTGKWVKIEDIAAGVNHALTSDQLMDRSDDNVTDYAGTWVWQVRTTDKYVVNLNPMGGYYTDDGTALPGSITGTVGGSKITLPTPKEFEQNGVTMKFVRWHTKYNSATNEYSGSTFAGGATVDNESLGLEAGQGGYVTLFAEWLPDSTNTGITKVWQQNAALTGYNLASTTEFEFNDAGTANVSVPTAPDGFVYNASKFTCTGGTATYNNETDPTYTVTRGSGAVELNLYYDRATYSITFNKNDGSTETKTENMPVGVSRALPANTFTREGYAFMGWNTKADGTGTAYTGQQRVKDLATTNQNVELYAQWAKGSSQPSSTGTYSFKLKTGQKVHFTNVPAGTTYKVVETNAPNGWTQTDDSHNTSGTVSAASTVDVSVTNTYDATGVVSLQAKKTMQSGSLAEGQFSFELRDSSGQVIQTVTNQAPAEGTATADILFNAIDYELSNLLDQTGKYVGSKEYTYTIQEVDDHQQGVEYDTTPQTVTVTVADAGTGKLTVTPSNVTTTGTGDDAVTTVSTVFTNDYQPGSLEVSKATTGTNAASANAAFTFSVKLTDAQGNLVNRRYDLVRKAADGTETTTTGGAEFINGVAAITGVHSGESFRIVGIAKDSAYEVFEYVVPGGFTQSAASGNVGTMGAGQLSTASFTNSYEATGGVQLLARKTIADASIADYTFNFQLYDQSNKLLQTKTNDASGIVTFDSLEFSALDAGTQGAAKAYSYRIVEVNDAQNNVAYDADSEWVTVNVWDDGQGNLHADPVYDNKQTAANFANKLLHPVELPATGGSGLAIPVAVVVIAATAEATRRMRRRK